MRHSYTNDTRGDGSVVVKRYEGPDAAERRRREHAMLVRLRGRIPVPPVLNGLENDDLRMGFVDGVHGQELIDAGLAAQALRACGEMLRRIHAIDPAGVFPGESHPPGAVLVHGDYGPNNVLLDPAGLAITAVLDWEWAHPGRAVEDVAWCEWIVRMHHSAHVDALDGFFDAYGHRPAWAARREAMLAQCRLMIDLCQRWAPGGEGVRQWQHRLAVSAAWTDNPAAK
jgi:aminoglycoside phosphotransferase (APT) family kinase protein